jgi:hypothetical protein
MPKQRKLTNLEVLETSGVDNAAHLHDGFLVMKSAEDKQQVTAQLLYALGKSKEDNLTENNQVNLTKAEYEDKIASLEAALEAAQSQAKDLADKLEEISEMSEGSEEVEAGYRMKGDMTDKEEHGDKAMDMDKEEMDKEEDEVEMAMQDMPKELYKSVVNLPIDQRSTFVKAFQAQQTEIQKASELVAKERDIRLDAEAVNKSKNEFQNVGIDHEVVAPALRRLELQDEFLAKTVREVLTAADAQVSESGLMKEYGTATTSTGTVFDEATALAKSLVDNGSAKTIEQGIDMVLDTNRELAKRYYEEA